MAIILPLPKLTCLLWTISFLLLLTINISEFGPSVSSHSLTQDAKHMGLVLSPTEKWFNNAYTDSYLPLVIILVKILYITTAFSFDFQIAFLCFSAQGPVGWSASTIWLGIIRRNRYFGIAKEQAPSCVLPADPPPASPTCLPQYPN